MSLGPVALPAVLRIALQAGQLSERETSVMIIGPLAHLVERYICNVEVAGPSPARSTLLIGE